MRGKTSPVQSSLTKRVHNAVFLPLIAYLIKQSTQTNGIVLDGFLGSASTLIACEQIDRTCYGVEFELKFVDVAVERYRKYLADNNGTADVYVIRDGQRIEYNDVPKPEEGEDENSQESM